MAYVITTAQNRAIHALLGRLKWMDHKAALVHHYGGGKSSVKELLYAEAAALVKYLQAEADKLPVPLDTRAQQRKKIHWLVGQLGWKTPSGGLDFDLLDGFIAKKGVVKKDIRLMSPAELTQTINQLEGVLRNNVGSSASKVVAALKVELGMDK